MSWIAGGILVKDRAEASRDGGGDKEPQLCPSFVGGQIKGKS